MVSRVADGVRLEVHGAFQNLPVHTGFALPDFDGLFLWQVVAQAVPRSSANVGHLFDLMSHDEFPLGAGRHKAPRMAQHRQSVMD